MYAYLDRPVVSLDRGSAFLLWAIRAAAGALVGRRCMGATLGPGFAKVDASAALPSFAMAMAVLVREANRTIAIGAACSPRVGDDEAVLLAILGATDPGAESRVAASIALLVDAPDARTCATRAARTLALELLSAGLAPARYEGSSRR